MSDHDTTSEAAQPPIEDRDYRVSIRVVGRVVVYFSAQSLEEAQQYAESCAESCDIDKEDIEISDYEVLELSEDT
jgi:hypothetical protein